MLKLTEEQILQARSISLLDYLQTYEPDNVRKSGANEYRMVEHDSLKISNGKWFRHSTQQGGHSALDFLIKVRGINFADAVISLSEGKYFSDYKEKSIPKAPPKPKPFFLPKKNKNNDRIISYLRGRGISKNVSNHCIKAELLYESEKHRCVFVGKDGEKPMFACERGTVDDWKKDISGSNKRYSFSLPPENSNKNNTLAVFESPIDVLAHFSIHEIGQTGMDGYRLSLGGVGSSALINFLERHTEIKNIHLALDNDTAGKTATKRIINELLGDKRFSHIKISVTPPPIGKDYADTLKAIQQLNMEKSKTPNRQNTAIF
jgi:hypothetical protein